jgi:hypothetical protein
MTIAWRVGQIVALLVVVAGFVFVARDFDITL